MVSSSQHFFAASIWISCCHYLMPVPANRVATFIHPVIADGHRRRSPGINANLVRIARCREHSVAVSEPGQSHRHLPRFIFQADPPQLPYALDKLVGRRLRHRAVALRRSCEWTAFIALLDCGHICLVFGEAFRGPTGVPSKGLPASR